MHFLYRRLAAVQGQSRNTVRHWLDKIRAMSRAIPTIGARACSMGVEALESWLQTDRHRAKREQRTAHQCIYSCVTNKAIKALQLCACIKNHADHPCPVLCAV